MMVNFFKLISFIFVLGLLLVPTSINACQKNSYKIIKEAKKTNVKTTATFSKLESSCENGTCTEGCCNKKSKSCGHDGCDGNCNVTSCFAGGFGSLCILSIFEVQKNNTDFSLFEKSFFHYINSEYSFGFYPIWQPPKIG